MVGYRIPVAVGVGAVVADLRDVRDAVAVVVEIIGVCDTVRVGVRDAVVAQTCFDPVPDAVVIGVEVEEVWLAVVVGIEGQGGEVAVSGFEGVGDGVAVGIVIPPVGQAVPVGVVAAFVVIEDGVPVGVGVGGGLLLGLRQARDFGWTHRAGAEEEQGEGGTFVVSLPREKVEGPAPGVPGLDGLSLWTNVYVRDPGGLLEPVGVGGVRGGNNVLEEGEVRDLGHGSSWAWVQRGGSECPPTTRRALGGAERYWQVLPMLLSVEMRSLGSPRRRP